MEFKSCNDILKELKQILFDANSSVLEMGKKNNNLTIIKMNFEQLSREVNSKMNSFDSMIRLLKTNFEREFILNEIDKLYDDFCKFDIDILLSYLKKNDLHEKELKSLEYLYMDKGNVQESNNILESFPTNPKTNIWEFILPKKVRLFIWGKERIATAQKSLNASKKQIENFMDITKRFRYEFKRILIFYDFIEEEISKENRLCLPPKTANDKSDNNSEEKKKPGPKEKIWMKGKLGQLSECDIEIILNEIYNKTKNFLFKDVEGIQRSKYNNIWSAIVFYSAKRIGFVEPDDKPGQPYEKTIKKVISNVSRNTIADYYHCIEKFFSTTNNTITDKMQETYSSLSEIEIKLVINKISEQFGVSPSKSHFIIANYKRIDELIETISYEFEKQTEIFICDNN